jgi:type IV pilus assembly protein PilA
MKKSGFTLVEVMIVVAIIGLLAAVGIPSIMNALSKAEEKSASKNLASIEKAKGMIQLPSDIHSLGKAVAFGTAYEDGNYSEANLMACIQGAGSLADLVIDSSTIDPGNIGSEASYDAD